MLNREIRTFRLGVVSADSENGVSLARTFGPLTEMVKQDRRLQLVPPPKARDGGQLFHWTWLAQCDAVLFSAPSAAAHADAIRLAKMMRVPVWLDFDDDLTCVTIDNPNAFRFPAEQTRELLKMMVGMGDVVTVTCEELKRRILSLNNHRSSEPARVGLVETLPNACHWPFINGSRDRVITWRGAGNHEANWLSVLPQVTEVAKLPQFSKFRWAFLGCAPWQVRKALPPSDNVDYVEFMDPFMFMEFWARLQPYLHIVPLEDNPFNRCRSNLAWIQATSVGAITLAPDMEEWRRPGVVNYKDAEDFKILLKSLLNGFGKGSEVQESREYIREHLLLPKINEQRWNILNRLWQVANPQTDINKPTHPRDADATQENHHEEKIP